MEQIKEIIKERIVGKIKAEHDAFGHHYRFVETGVLVDSVTGVLKILEKEHLLRWAVRKGIEWLEIDNRFSRLTDPTYRNQYMVAASTAYTEYRDDAGSVGTDAHNAIELFIKDWMRTGELPADIKMYFKAMADPRSIAAARAVERIFRTENIVPLASEILVGNQKYSAGTLDFLCLWDGELTLVDFKTSNQIGDDFAMQVAIYKDFFEFMTGLKIKRCRILHLSKDMDKFTLYLVRHAKRAAAAFKALCTVYNWRFVSKEVKIIKDIKRVTI